MSQIALKSRDVKRPIWPESGGWIAGGSGSSLPLRCWRILSKQGMECTPVFHNLFPHSSPLHVYKQSPKEEGKTRGKESGRDVRRRRSAREPSKYVRARPSRMKGGWTVREEKRKEKGDGENCKRQEDKMNNRLTGEGEREMGESDEGKEERKKWECPRNDLNAPLGVHIPSRQIMQHSTPKFRPAEFFIQLGDWEHWVATVFISLCALSSRMLQERNNMEEIGCTAGTSQGVGWEGKRRWRGGGGWAGMQSLKISQAAEREAGPQAVQRHTFTFCYFCCFFHNVWSLPYKLMTRKVLQLRHKKTHWSCQCNFPSTFAKGAVFCQKQTTVSKCIHRSWGRRLVMEILGDCAEEPSSKNVLRYSLKRRVH